MVGIVSELGLSTGSESENNGNTSLGTASEGSLTGTDTSATTSTIGIFVTLYEILFAFILIVCDSFFLSRIKLEDLFVSIELE
jgi:hypothetical protein